MFRPLPMLLKDGYKIGHIFQYPDKTTLVSNNMTARSTRVPNCSHILLFGPQYYVQRYLIDDFEENFFNQPLDDVLYDYKRRIKNYLGKDLKSYDHIADLHKLGYLPLHIKALPEGALVPYRVPFLTSYNSLDEFYWLPNMLETLQSATLWQPITSATTAFRYRRTFEDFARITGADREFIKWQGHDFSMRGMPGVDAGLVSGAAHQLSFTGTDTICAIDFLEYYYFANCEKELIGGSVDATEHAVMQMGGKDNEIDTFYRLIHDVSPDGIISIVSDTWDFWQVITQFLPKLKDVIMQRNGKVVIRPDSGDPVKIICGDPNAQEECIRKGAIQCLWDIFGGTTTSKGFRVLDSHIGLIYGDSITEERQHQILNQLRAKGFASSNVVLGIGSFTYQHNTRDTHGMAVKATYGEVEHIGRSIFKTPKTDDGTKNSAKGLLRVNQGPTGYTCEEDVTWDREAGGCLRSIFHNGVAENQETLADLRKRVEEQL